MSPDGQSKFDYFIERTEKDLADINKKLDKLMEFRWKILGGTMVVSAVISFLSQVFLRS